MDHQLIEQVRAGDRDAFGQMVDASFDRWFGIARRVLADTSLAQDATQAAMLSIWRDLPKLWEPARFEAWAYRIVVHACYAEARRARRSIVEIRALAEPIEHDGTGDVIDRDRLERAFSRQKVEHRAVLVLRYYLDMTVDEVADTLGVPTGTVKSRIHHALKSMRAAIDADDRPPSGGSTATDDFSTSLTARGAR